MFSCLFMSNVGRMVFQLLLLFSHFLIPYNIIIPYGQNIQEITKSGTFMVNLINKSHTSFKRLVTCYWNIIISNTFPLFRISFKIFKNFKMQIYTFSCLVGDYYKNCQKKVNFLFQDSGIQKYLIQIFTIQFNPYLIRFNTCLY